ncbi:MAG: 3',5'-cyclic-nucleotide phosphodiesterase [Gammaproteobacteria bacterium]|nr:3',5'-cyclic-nucleotide phosphodiesterase [Gammaproteobacteria bacterium]
MKIRVLGCSGGLGGERQTTAFLVDDDVLVEAGTGVVKLEMDELRRINHVFITHAHLDHVACLPIMVDTVGSTRAEPVMVHATEGCLENLRKHVFNWCIWPDFSCIPSQHDPYMRYTALELGQVVELGRDRRIRALPVEHTVPAVGYQISGPGGSLVFSGDTTCCDAFWEAVNGIRDLRYLVIETAFSDEEKDIAVTSKHLCPSMLSSELEQLKQQAEIYITHLKPREETRTMAQIQAIAGSLQLRRLEQGQIFDLT